MTEKQRLPVTSNRSVQSRGVEAVTELPATSEFAAPIDLEELWPSKSAILAYSISSAELQGSICPRNSTFPPNPAK